MGTPPISVTTHQVVERDGSAGFGEHSNGINSHPSPAQPSPASSHFIIPAYTHHFSFSIHSTRALSSASILFTMRSTIVAVALSLAFFQSCSADSTFHFKRLLGLGAASAPAGLGSSCGNMGGLIPLNLLSTNTCVMGGGGGPMSCGDMTGGLLGLNLLSTNTCMSMKNAESDTQENDNQA
ncbi:hypothetical protein PCANC_04902 [Puccinia coronata f. sp. avenae]|uniref:Uncharacterized protein n=1 Tax=Puccinia coronata f. sp. avenae TaxID=200324 RepID=A0A2N5VWI8_9BASI|nr:hypothetical protein PCANC_18112 [Puccinia coronata f. sp. avenae]PLW16771.1 hypothetical protein PCASD_17168 [Puccinia coronata f. sp. avenae]PLW48625.1 hypothetical protein PCASD_03386 [Puccinia coronata f. sp. avenae]PLW54368.1 hypothetical protein PCANC_04902 [Puccinia coronata f. sp. avenae]